MGIELLRGIAAMMVLLTHYAAFMPGWPPGVGYLWTGVDFFFVISGFVFAPMLLADPALRDVSHAARQDSLGGFWLRRLFRIYPLYLLALVLYFITQPDTPQSTPYFLRHLVFLHTTSSFEEAYFFNPAFWSLPVEMEYYFLLPLLALFRHRPRILIGVGLASFALTLAANGLRGPQVDIWRILSVHLPTLLPEFLLGAGLAELVTRARQRSMPWHAPLALGLLVLGVLLLWGTWMIKYGDVGLADNRWLDAPWNFLCAAGYAAVSFPLLVIADKHWPPLLARFARGCGVASYGIYLLHNLMPLWLRKLGMAPSGYLFVLVSLGLTVVLALILYRFYENPLRQLGRRLSARVNQ